MQQLKVCRFLILIVILFLASCAYKYEVVEGDEVYLQNTTITSGTQKTYLTFSDFDGHQLTDYYSDYLFEKLSNRRFKIPSGLKNLRVYIDHFSENNVSDSSNQVSFSQSFYFEVATRPQQTYKAVSEVDSNNVTVWIVNSSGIKVSETITKKLQNYSDYSNDPSIIDPDKYHNTYPNYYPYYYYYPPILSY